MGFYIGNVFIKNKVGLAPMAGVSNPSYMKICEEMGLGFAVTELISAEAIVRDNKKTFDMLNGIDSLNIPVGVQLFGADASVISRAAIIITKLYNVSFIDINMGCPVPKVALKGGAGSALLKDPDKVYDIVYKTVCSVSVPVTVKIRSGWDSVNALNIASVIERAGASAITIHPRTRNQGYSGKADWDVIKSVKECVSIPVIGNGDINSCFDAKKMLDYTNCDAVMIGRACIGNPWIIRDSVNYLDGILPCDILLDDRISIIKKHLSYLINDKCERVAVLEMRMHISKYLKGIKGANNLNILINQAKSADYINILLDKFKEDFYV